MDITALTPEAFGLIRQEWDDLLERSASDSVFLRWAWMHTWWTVFKGNKRLLILTARRDGRLVGIAPLYIDPEGAGGSRVLKLCSDELAPDYLDIIADQEGKAEIARALVQGLLQRKNEWDIISFDNLRADSLILSDPSWFKGYFRTVEISHYCPYIEIKETFDDYYKQRTELIHFTLEKKLKRLYDQMNVVHKLADDATSVAKGLDDLFAMHEKRAKEKKIQSNFVAGDAKRFHHDVCRIFLAERILNLQLFYDGVKPISAIYALNYKNKVHVYQTGFDPRWSKFSVGGALFFLGVQKAFNDQFKEYDFLKGTESYKSLWTNAVHEEMLLTVYNRNGRGFAEFAWTMLKRVLRPVKQAIRARKLKPVATAA